MKPAPACCEKNPPQPSRHDRNDLCRGLQAFNQPLGRLVNPNVPALSIGIGARLTGLIAVCHQLRVVGRSEAIHTDI